MRYEPVQGFPELHETLWLSFIEIENAQVRVSISGSAEHFVHITFQPYQAFRVITEDCFEWPPGLSPRHRVMFEVESSPWIEELKAALARKDPRATFMDRARHYLIPSRDSVVEVVAWGTSWELVRVQTDRSG